MLTGKFKHLKESLKILKVRLVSNYEKEKLIEQQLQNSRKVEIKRECLLIIELEGHFLFFWRYRDNYKEAFSFQVSVAEVIKKGF